MASFKSSAVEWPITVDRFSLCMEREKVGSNPVGSQKMNDAWHSNCSIKLGRKL